MRYNNIFKILLLQISIKAIDNESSFYEQLKSRSQKLSGLLNEDIMKKIYQDYKDAMPNLILYLLNEFVQTHPSVPINVNSTTTPNEKKQDPQYEMFSEICKLMDQPVPLDPTSNTNISNALYNKYHFSNKNEGILKKLLVTEINKLPEEILAHIERFIATKETTKEQKIELFDAIRILMEQPVYVKKEVFLPTPPPESKEPSLILFVILTVIIIVGGLAAFLKIKALNKKNKELRSYFQKILKKYEDKQFKNNEVVLSDNSSSAAFLDDE